MYKDEGIRYSIQNWYQNILLQIVFAVYGWDVAILDRSKQFRRKLLHLNSSLVGVSMINLRKKKPNERQL